MKHAKSFLETETNMLAEFIEELIFVEGKETSRVKIVLIFYLHLFYIFFCIF